MPRALPWKVRRDTDTPAMSDPTTRSPACDPGGDQGHRSPGAALAALLARGDGPLVLPCPHDALSARLAVAEGFEAMFLGGYRRSRRARRSSS